MGNIIVGTLLRLLVSVCGAAAGAVCVYTAGENGRLLDAGEAGRFFGLGFMAIVVFSWTAWPLASWCARLGASAWSLGLKLAWIPLFIFVVSNAIMFTASHRVETVEGKGHVIEAYDGAKESRSRLLGELVTLKANPAWEASKACTARAKGSKVLCEQKAQLESRIQAAEAIIAKGKPGAKDAGAETLAWVIQGDAAKVGRAWPVYIAVMLEMVASLAFKLALSPWSPKRVTGIFRNSQIAEPEADAEPAAPDALAQITALVLASPNRSLATSVRELSKALGIARSTLHDQLKDWHAQGRLNVEAKDGKTVIRLADRRAA